MKQVSLAVSGDDDVDDGGFEARPGRDSKGGEVERPMGPGSHATGANGRPPIDRMGSFLTACGATGPLTLEIEGPAGPGTGRIVLSRPFALLGRDDRADVLLDHDLVSRRHTFLQVIEGRIFFIDLESREKTLLDGSPAESGWLLPGRTLGVGPYRIHLAPTDDAAAGERSGPTYAPLSIPPSPLLARSTESSDLPSVALEFESRSAGHSVWRMSQVMAVLGRSPRCRVRVYDPNVSKLHCALLRTSSGLWVVDLLGRDGITANGQPVRYAPLGEGDVLGVSQVLMRPRGPGAFPRPSPPPPPSRPSRPTPTAIPSRFRGRRRRSRPSTPASPRLRCCSTTSARCSARCNSSRTTSSSSRC
jgi:pSer/pThr/pTyr-binding forkhead associated (FHA) protein